jgi:acyl-CoA thioester hydrolase
VRINVEPSTDPHDYSFVHHIGVRFAETDAMGIVHHASYLLYLEEARVAYLREVGHDYANVRASGLNFAVIEATVKYVRACVFGDELAVHVRLAAHTKATFQIAYLLTVDSEARALAVTAHACVDHEGRPTRLPDWIAELGHVRAVEQSLE